jgi:hypothetical protein
MAASTSRLELPMETRWIVLLICLSIPALLAGATIWIQMQNRRISGWRQAPGRIVSSKPVAREVRSKDFSSSGSDRHTDFVTEEKIETRNFAEISYTFPAAANTYRGSRIGLGADPGNFGVAETLKRYPEGNAVTVYYNPRNPNECILERDDPANIRKAWLAVAVLVAVIVIGFVAITQGADRLSGIFAQPKLTPLVVVLGLFALVIMLFARMLGKQARAMKAWPKTAGRITRSEVATTLRETTSANSGRVDDVTMYVPRIVYTFAVDGISFDGNKIGWSGSASTPAYAEKAIKRFPLQTPVTVFYNPQDPTQSTLTLAGGMFAVVLWLLAAIMAGAAFSTAWFAMQAAS